APRKEPIGTGHPQVDAHGKEHEEAERGHRVQQAAAWSRPRRGLALLALLGVGLEDFVEGADQRLLLGAGLLRVVRGRHATRSCWRAEATSAGKVRMSIGLVMYPSKPARSARSRSPAIAWAVSATIRCPAWAEARISESRAKPSLPGSWMSSSTSSGWCASSA